MVKFPSRSPKSPNQDFRGALDLFDHLPSHPLKSWICADLTSPRHPKAGYYQLGEVRGTCGDSCPFLSSGKKSYVQEAVEETQTLPCIGQIFRHKVVKSRDQAHAHAHAMYTNDYLIRPPSGQIISKLP